MHSEERSFSHSPEPFEYEVFYFAECGERERYCPNGLEWIFLKCGNDGFEFSGRMRFVLVEHGI